MKHVLRRESNCEHQKQRRTIATMTFAPDLSGTNLGMMGQPVPQGAKKVHQLSEESMAMRDYALGEDGRSRSDGTVLLHVSHSNLKNTFFHELRLEMHSNIEAIKRKLEFHTGTSAVTNQVSPSPALARRATQGWSREMGLLGR